MLSVVINSESCGCNTCGASDTDGDKGVVNDVNFECMKDRLICDDPEGSSLKITFPKAMFESERSQPTDVKKTSDTDKNRGKWKNSKHVKSTRPNYFIGIQVNDKNILDNVKLVQETMIQNEPLLKSAMIPVATFHLTLLVMHLASNEEIQRAGDLLKQCYEEIKEDFLANPVSLEFSGLNHFNNQVLFAQVKSDAELARVTMLAHSIHKAFTESKFNLSGNKEFKPHATLCKLSKDPGLRKKGVEQIREETFIKHINDQFGKQTVTGLQLLSMMKRKDTSGYYFTEKEYKFVNDL
ncbi:akap7 (predicted) [Pycnogonum litorale]